MMLFRCVTLISMTLTKPSTTPAPKPSRRQKRWLVLAIAVFVVVAGWLGYFAHYGECSGRGDYCTLAIAGTRSEVGVAWDGGVTHPDFYVSTWPNG
jgi:hypothetical protein